MKIVFLISAGILFASSACLINSSLGHLHQATNAIQSSNEDILSITYDANKYIGRLERTRENATTVDFYSILNFNDYCPQATDLKRTQFFATIDNTIKTVRKSKKLFQKFLDVDFNAMKQQVTVVQSVSRSVDDVIEDISERGWYFRAFVLVLGVFVTFLVLGVVLACCNSSPYIFTIYLSYFILPIFVFGIFVSWFLISASSAASVVNVDICSAGNPRGNPDDTILNVFRTRNVSKDHVLHQSFDYVKRCMSTDSIVPPFNIPPINNAVGEMDKLLAKLDIIPMPDAGMGCEEEIFGVVDNAQKMIWVLREIVEIALLLIELIECDAITPIYENVVYGATCRHLPYALGWMLLSFFGISISGMVMVTLRSSLMNLSDIEYDSPEETQSVDDDLFYYEDEIDSYWNASAPCMHTVITSKTQSTADTEDTSVTADVAEAIVISPRAVESDDVIFLQAHDVTSNGIIHLS
eukprot:CAMPEP_0172521514 /NCGR_PEP_ID=MMETSP1066-20121228/292621_1 /TAXON_ID=671091 /ORGANISM="Coscinodiscus wailesii, Strain CCMP2513" /LENGTH=467 /DNA_ID=CAMNT_0013304433 /DNA_START=489 /DNA_END=1892 /DNA_ORIENTATION=-